mgnify:CR=1 FL=1
MNKQEIKTGHGMYTSHSIKSYLISKEVYNYLLPIYGRAAENKKYSYPDITERKEGCFLYCSEYQHKEVMDRIKYMN